MRLFLTLLGCGLLAGANVLLGYYAAPQEISLTPVIVIGITLLLLRAPGPLLLRSGLAALLICAHDAGVKLLGGGAHDLEGQGVIHLFLFLGLLPALAVVLNAADNDQTLSRRGRWAVRLLFPLVLAGHLACNGWLGTSQDWRQQAKTGQLPAR